jgi:phosphate acetyltransferase/phosphate butyryltransferase
MHVAAAASDGFIAPVFIGSRRLIEELAQAAGIDAGAFELVDVGSPAQAVLEAIRLAREGRVQAILKAGISTEELIGPAISASTGLRIARRMSHVYALDVPTYPKPLFITDAMINIAPGLSAKREICQNSIDLARSLGIRHRRWRCWPPSRRSIRRCRPPSTPPPCARWPNAGRSRAASWMAR